MSNVWNGRAARVSPAHFAEAAQDAGVEPAVLQAIWEVEAGSRPFRADGSVERRFEPHQFAAFKRLGWDWKSSLKIKTAEREALFAEAYLDHPEAALRATSWGGPQIMGSNFKDAGFVSATKMVQAFADSEAEQIAAMLRLAGTWGLGPALRAHDWVAFARRWNGSGQPEVYARKIEAAYRKHSGASSPVVLRVGDRGAGVKRLQEALGLRADGTFGPETLEAVKAYQKRADLPADGVVGARTWSALIEEQDARPIKQGTSTDSALGAVEKIAGGATVAAGAVEAVRRSLPEDVFSYAIYAALGLATIYAAITLIRRARAVV